MRWWAKTDGVSVMIDGKSTQVEGIIAFFNAVDTYLKKYAKNERTRVYFLFDNADTIYERKQISDDYKANRKKNEPPKHVYRQLDFCELICHYYRNSSYLFRVPSLEADDFVKNILRSYVKDSERVLMISEDMDWSRYIGNNVEQYKNHRIWNPDTFRNEYGFDPLESNITFYKAFYGDKSDNIIGYLPNLPNLLFMEIIGKFTKMDDFLRNINSLENIDLGWKCKIDKERNNLIMNWNLISSAEISDASLSCYKYNCSYKVNKLRMIYASLGLIGKIDSRVSYTKSKTSIFDMLGGELLERSRV